MKSLMKKPISFFISCFVIVFFIAGSIILAQEKSDDDLKKEYAQILGMGDQQH